MSGTIGDVPLIVRISDCLLGNYVTVDSPECQTLIGRDDAGVQAVGRNRGDVTAGDSAIPSSTFAGRSNAMLGALVLAGSTVILEVRECFSSEAVLRFDVCDQRPHFPKAYSPK